VRLREALLWTRNRCSMSFSTPMLTTVGFRKRTCGPPSVTKNSSYLDAKGIPHVVLVLVLVLALALVPLSAKLVKMSNHAHHHQHEPRYVQAIEEIGQVQGLGPDRGNVQGYSREIEAIGRVLVPGPENPLDPILIRAHRNEQQVATMTTICLQVSKISSAKWTWSVFVPRMPS